MVLPLMGLGPGLPTMVVLDSLLTLTCCCSRTSNSNSSSKATGRWASMVNLEPRATQTTSKVEGVGHGVLLVVVEVDQGHPFQRAKHPLEQTKELRKGSRLCSWCPTSLPTWPTLIPSSTLLRSLALLSVSRFCTTSETQH